MSKFVTFALKSTFYSTLIIGGGYALMTAVVPKEDELRKTIQEHRAKRGEMLTSTDKQVFRAQMNAIIENAKSDRPIWDVKFPTLNDNENK